MCPEHTGLDPEVGLQTQGEGRVSRGAGRYDAGRVQSKKKAEEVGWLRKRSLKEVSGTKGRRQKKKKKKGEVSKLEWPRGSRR